MTIGSPEFKGRDERRAQLQAWLDKHEAMRLWQAKTGTLTVESWRFPKTSSVALVVTYKDGHGFNIYTDGNEIAIDATFLDAERRLGLAPETSLEADGQCSCEICKATTGYSCEMPCAYHRTKCTHCLSGNRHGNGRP